MKNLVRILIDTLKVTIGVASLVLITAYLAGGFREKVLPGVVAAPEQIHGEPVKFAEVFSRKESQVDRIPGTVAAKHEISVSSRILATIQDVLVRSGDTIRPGSPLVILDSRDLEARELQSRQQLAAAQAQLDEAHREYVRVESLYKENVVPLSKYDQVERAFRVAVAQLDASRQALQEARVSQTYARIQATLPGRVIDRLAEPGDTAIPGQPLLKLYNPSELRLEAYVRESLATKLQRGNRVIISIDALSTTLEGTVEEVVPQADPGARAFLVKIGLPVDDRIYPGMFGRLLLETGETENTYVKSESIHTVGQLDYVMVVENGKIIGMRFVKLGKVSAEGFRQVLSGLAAGEQVALSDIHH